MSKVIGVLSGKGGVGKTTIVSNLGASITNDFNRNVLILDSNMKTSHLGLHLGVYENFPVTLEEVLKNEVSPTYAIFIHPSIGVRILPAPLDGGSVEITRLKSVVNSLKNAYECIIIDCAPGLGKEVIMAIKCIDSALVVTTPDLPAVTDALKTITLLERLKKDVLGIVLNRVRNAKFELTEEEVESTCGYNVIAKIPEDSKIPESIANGVPVIMYDKNSKSSIALKKLSAHIIGEEYEAPGMFEIMRDIFDFKKLLPTFNGLGRKVGFRSNGLMKKPEVQMEEREAFKKEKKIADFKSDAKTWKDKGKKYRASEELLDVEKLRDEISEELKNDLKRSVKSEIKKKVLERLKERTQ